MAITAASTTSDFSGFLNPAQSAPIFDEAARQSAVQALAPRIPLGISGQAIPHVTSKPTANWVGEAGKKPATQGALGLITMEPKKLAAIAVMSAEVVRANPGNYVNILRSSLAEAFATAFDLAALHNVGGDGTGTGPFDNYVDETTKSVEMGTATQANGGIYADINAGLELLVNDKRKLRGFVFDDIAEPTFNGAVDLNGRPLFVDSPYENTSLQSGRLLRRQTVLASDIGTAVVTGTPNTGGIVGYGGDWSKTAWGAVGGISYRISTEATVTINGALTSLFENNLVAVLAEAEYGWVMEDPENFVVYTDHD